MFASRSALLTRPNNTVVKRTVGETFSGSTTPPGITVLPLNANAPSTVSVSSGIMREGNSGTSGSPFVTAVKMPEVMGTDFFTVSATNGNLANVDRSFGCGCMNEAGDKAVFAFGAGNSTAIRINTYSGGVITPVGVQSSTFFTSSSDILKLVPSIVGADIVWTVQKNGVNTTAVWTDTGGAFGLPGKIPILIFRHFYTGGTQYTSPGIRAWTAADI